MAIALLFLFVAASSILTWLTLLPVDWLATIVLPSWVFWVGILLLLVWGLGD